MSLYDELIYSMEASMSPHNAVHDMKFSLGFQGLSQAQFCKAPLRCQLKPVLDMHTWLRGETGKIMATPKGFKSDTSGVFWWAISTKPIISNPSNIEFLYWHCTLNIYKEIKRFFSLLLKEVVFLQYSIFPIPLNTISNLRHTNKTPFTAIWSTFKEVLNKTTILRQNNVVFNKHGF